MTAAAAFAPRSVPKPDFGAPLDQRIMWLDAQQHDPEGYAQLWLSAMEAVGDVQVVLDAEGEHMMMGVVAGEHDMERLRWLRALDAHLKATEHRAPLRRLLYVRGKVLDGRTRNAASVTRAIRDYLTTGGAILVTPSGKLTERVSFSPGSLQTEEEFAAAGRACRAYQLARRWPGAERHILRAARMAGQPTDNGWLVLEAVA